MYTFLCLVITEMASKRQAESDEVSSVDSLPQSGQTSDIPPKSKLRKTECGLVYVGRISRAQKQPRRDGVTNINVTSGSGNKIAGIPIAKVFSPLYIGPVVDGDGLVFKTMEGYWQGNKIYKELGHLDKDNKTTLKWESFRREQAGLKKGVRHPLVLKTTEVKYVDSKGRKWYKYLLPICAKYNGEVLGYLDSRKRAYTPKYYSLVVQTKAFKALKERVENGENVMILDFDGPQGEPDGCEVTIDFLKTKINDTTVPFGHGYVLAGALLGIEPSLYCCE